MTIEKETIPIRAKREDHRVVRVIQADRSVRNGIVPPLHDLIHEAVMLLAVKYADESAA